jgi:hypothetical protein
MRLTEGYRRILTGVKEILKNDETGREAASPIFQLIYQLRSHINNATKGI